MTNNLYAMEDENRKFLIEEIHSKLMSFKWDKMYLVDEMLPTCYPKKDDLSNSLKKTAAWIADSIPLIEETVDLPVTVSTYISVTKMYGDRLHLSLNYYDSFDIKLK